jgi:hypothetical protein
MITKDLYTYTIIILRQDKPFVITDRDTDLSPCPSGYGG